MSYVNYVCKAWYNFASHKPIVIGNLRLEPQTSPAVVRATRWKIDTFDSVPILVYKFLGIEWLPGKQEDRILIVHPSVFTAVDESRTDVSSYREYEDMGDYIRIVALETKRKP